jgi:hypothetical protein
MFILFITKALQERSKKMLVRRIKIIVLHDNSSKVIAMGKLSAFAKWI